MSNAVPVGCSFAGDEEALRHLGKPADAAAAGVGGSWVCTHAFSVTTAPSSAALTRHIPPCPSCGFMAKLQFLQMCPAGWVALAVWLGWAGLGWASSVELCLQAPTWVCPHKH